MKKRNFNLVGLSEGGASIKSSIDESRIKDAIQDIRILKSSIQKILQGNKLLSRRTSTLERQLSQIVSLLKSDSVKNELKKILTDEEVEGELCDCSCKRKSIVF